MGELSLGSSVAILAQDLAQGDTQWVQVFFVVLSHGFLSIALFLALLDNDVFKFCQCRDCPISISCRTGISTT